jgi:hypothetical protein
MPIAGTGIDLVDEPAVAVGNIRLPIHNCEGLIPVHPSQLAIAVTTFS